MNILEPLTVTIILHFLCIDGITPVPPDLSCTVEDPVPAVTVRDGYKRYSSVVLRGLNMTVPEGTM